MSTTALYIEHKYVCNLLAAMVNFQESSVSTSCAFNVLTLNITNIQALNNSALFVEFSC